MDVISGGSLGTSSSPSFHRDVLASSRSQLRRGADALIGKLITGSMVRELVGAGRMMGREECSGNRRPGWIDARDRADRRY